MTSFIEADIYEINGGYKMARFIHESESGQTHFIFKDANGKEHRMMLGMVDVETMGKFVNAVSKTPLVNLSKSIRIA